MDRTYSEQLQALTDLNGLPVWRGLLAPLWGQSVLGTARGIEDFVPILGGMIRPTDDFRDALSLLAKYSQDLRPTRPSLSTIVAQDEALARKPFYRDLTGPQAYPNPGGRNPSVPESQIKEFGKRMLTYTPGEERTYHKLIWDLLPNMWR